VEAVGYPSRPLDLAGSLRRTCPVDMLLVTERTFHVDLDLSRGEGLRLEDSCDFHFYRGVFISLDQRELLCWVMWILLEVGSNRHTLPS
jgi:hypothetical protein